MTEEVKLPSKEELLATMEPNADATQEADGNVESQKIEGKEPTEIEEKALAEGWNPEGVEGKVFLTAEEFMGRQPLYDDIHSLKKQLRRTQESVEAMKKMQEGIRSREREKTLAELKAAKRNAFEEQDFDALIEIDDKIATETANKEAPAENVAFETWVDSNEWYHQDDEMRKYADLIGTGYVAQNEGMAPEKVFEYVEQEVKARFATKFENPKRSRQTMTEGASRGRTTTAPSAKHKVSELSEQDRQIMRTIVRSGTMSEAEYLKEYFGE